MMIITATHQNEWITHYIKLNLHLPQARFGWPLGPSDPVKETAPHVLPHPEIQLDHAEAPTWGGCGSTQWQLEAIRDPENGFQTYYLVVSALQNYAIGERHPISIFRWLNIRVSPVEIIISTSSTVPLPGCNHQPKVLYNFTECRTTSHKTWPGPGKV
jgi:hypothetical protein